MIPAIISLWNKIIRYNGPTSSLTAGAPRPGPRSQFPPTTPSPPLPLFLLPGSEIQNHSNPQPNKQSTHVTSRGYSRHFAPHPASPRRRTSATRRAPIGQRLLSGIQSRQGCRVLAAGQQHRETESLTHTHTHPHSASRRAARALPNSARTTGLSLQFGADSGSEARDLWIPGNAGAQIGLVLPGFLAAFSWSRIGRIVGAVGRFNCRICCELRIVGAWSRSRSENLVLIGLVFVAFWGSCSDRDSIRSAARSSNSVSIRANPASPMLDLQCPGSAFAGLAWSRRQFWGFTGHLAVREQGNWVAIGEDSRQGGRWSGGEMIAAVSQVPAGWGEDEMSVLPRHTKVVVTGNNRTKSVLVGLHGVVKKAVGLGGWHWLVIRCFLSQLPLTSYPFYSQILFLLQCKSLFDWLLWGLSWSVLSDQVHVGRILA